MNASIKLLDKGLVTAEQLQQIVAKVVEAAIGGDLRACEIVLDRSIAKIKPLTDPEDLLGNLADDLKAARLRAMTGIDHPTLEELIMRSHEPETPSIERPEIPRPPPCMYPGTPAPAPESERPLIRLRPEPETRAEPGVYLPATLNN